MASHQILVTAAPGDATTASAFEYQRLLQADGPSEIFARYIHPDLAGAVRPIGEYAGGDRLVFHAAVGDPVVFPLVAARPEPLIVVYHNVAPEEPFVPWDPTFAQLLAEGRQQVASLAGRAVLALAPSQFSASELQAMGYRDVRVCPLVVHLGEQQARSTGAAPTLLFVGQLFPHKRVELIVMTAHILATHLQPDIRAVVVGPSRLPAYRDAITAQIAELGAPVDLTGAVSDAELHERYRSADVFLTASEHEGFCVPVIEAMARGIPVVARANGALPETLGDGGLLLSATAGPELLAEAVHAVLSDTDLGVRLVAAGAERVKAFDPERARTAFLAAVRSVSW